MKGSTLDRVTSDASSSSCQTWHVLTSIIPATGANNLSEPVPRTIVGLLVHRANLILYKTATQKKCTREHRSHLDLPGTRDHIMVIDSVLHITIQKIL